MMKGFFSATLQVVEFGNSLADQEIASPVTMSVMESHNVVTTVTSRWKIVQVSKKISRAKRFHLFSRFRTTESRLAIFSDLN